MKTSHSRSLTALQRNALEARVKRLAADLEHGFAKENKRFAAIQIGDVTMAFAIGARGKELRKFVREEWKGRVDIPRPV